MKDRIPRIDLDMARRIAFAASGLGDGPAFPRGLEGCAEAIAHLGSVQLDTISVVERAHHHILFQRVPRYATSMPARLEQGPGRRMVEYWSHAAAWLPVGDWRYCLPRMERVRANGHDWFRAEADAVRRALDRVRAEGPLRARDFEAGAKGRAGWWDWRPAKVALEYLFHAGELATVTRQGFEKVYDLTERVLPPGLDTSRPDEGAMAAWYVDTAVRSLGIFLRRDVAYMRKDALGGIDAEMARRLEEGRLVQVALEGPGTWYTTPAALEAGPAGGRAGGTTPRPFARILSPFDPLVIDRRRLARLFGLDYTIECYVPEAKRRFGYFALPLFFGDGAGTVRAAGLLDAKAERAESTLVLRRLAPQGIEPRKRASFAAALAREIGRYATFNGCERVRLERLDCPDERLARLLVDRLGSGGDDRGAEAPCVAAREGEVARRSAREEGAADLAVREAGAAGA